MQYQAITTEYHGPSNTKPGRIFANAGNGRIRHTHEYDHELSLEGNHDKAMQDLCKRLDWPTENWVSGGLRNGNVYVRTK